MRLFGMSSLALVLLTFAAAAPGALPSDGACSALDPGCRALPEASDGVRDQPDVADSASLLQITSRKHTQEMEWREEEKPRPSKLLASAGGRKASVLCDPLLVAEVCTKWNEADIEYKGSAADMNASVVHKYELAEHFVVHQDSVAELFRSIGAANVETNQDALSRGAFAVTCMDLCRKVLHGIPEDQQPPSPDLGCYWPSRGGGMKCDVDVSDEAFSKIQFRDHEHPEDEARQYGEDRKAPPSDDQSKATPSNDQATVDQNLLHGEPPRTDAERSRLEELRQPHRSVNELRINIANLFRIYPPTKIIAEVKSNPGAAAMSAIELSKEEQMDTMDQLKKLAVQGKAYSQKVLDKMDQKAAAEHVVTWFGNNEEKTRKEIRRVLSGVVAMLDNVDFVYPGDYCKDDTYAYVMPKCTKEWKDKGWCTQADVENGKGQKIFYICPLTLKSEEGVQIETMTHEGSHHLTMATDDVKTKGLGPYGRGPCKQRAKIDPEGALKNADNLCYFINDVSAPTRVAPTTTKGCTCTSEGAALCGSKDNGYCCNSDNDPAGSWCRTTENCGGTNWDYCTPATR